MNAQHTAWRFLGNQVAYVQENDCKQGDKYSYTSDVDKALEMTEAQCRKFCRYMYDCASVGFWN